MKRLELMIGEVLRFGTIASSALLTVGLLMIVAGYRSNVASVLLDAGIVILIATPAARVVVSVVEYIRERDWPFVVLTVIVLGALGASVVAAYL